MKKIIVAFLVLSVMGIGVFYFLAYSQRTNENQEQLSEQVVLEKTFSISKEYVDLRYRTDNVLIEAEKYSDYEKWNAEMSTIIKSWKALEKNASELEILSQELTQEKTGFNLIKTAFAYDKQEISNIFDKAPAGKKIATLAKHLGVDAKIAMKILQQDQAQVEADAWNEAGDTFQKLETSAVVIKDGCKVAGFVGTIALTGGTAAIATSGTLGQTAVVVSGADLVLEVTDDAAKIALGNQNKVSTIVGNVRTVTEPASAILMISTLPQNLTKGIDKLNAVTFGADQLNTTIQDGKVIGIDLPKYVPNTTKSNIQNQTISIVQLNPKEIEPWLQEIGTPFETETIESIEAVIKIENSSTETETIVQTNVEQKAITEEKSTTATKEMGGEHSEPISSFGGSVWSGALTNISGGSRKKYVTPFEITLNNDGSANLTKGDGYGAKGWIQIDNTIRIFEGTPDAGYYEFVIEGNTLVLSKIVMGGMEILAGSEFMGGIAAVGTLQRQ